MNLDAVDLIEKRAMEPGQDLHKVMQLGYLAGKYMQRLQGNNDYIADEKEVLMDISHIFDEQDYPLAIRETPWKIHGCPFCGCNYITSHMQGGGCMPGECKECGKSYVVVSDTLDEISIKINGKSPMIVDHPREVFKAHDLAIPDNPPKEENAEWFNSRGVGYDLAGFVKCKAAGERIDAMVQEVLEIERGEHSDSFLDYRIDEPLWIQYKFKEHEFDVKMLDKKTKEAGGIITKEMLISCLLDFDAEFQRVRIYLGEMCETNTDHYELYELVDFTDRLPGISFYGDLLRIRARLDNMKEERFERHKLYKGLCKEVRDFARADRDLNKLQAYYKLKDKLVDAVAYGKEDEMEDLARQLTRLL